MTERTALEHVLVEGRVVVAIITEYLSSYRAVQLGLAMEGGMLGQVETLLPIPAVRPATSRARARATPTSASLSGPSRPW